MSFLYKVNAVDLKEIIDFSDLYNIVISWDNQEKIIRQVNKLIVGTDLDYEDIVEFCGEVKDYYQNDIEYISNDLYMNRKQINILNLMRDN